MKKKFVDRPGFETNLEIKSPNTQPGSFSSLKSLTSYDTNPNNGLDIYVTKAAS